MIRALIGLGNSGVAYETTYHNVGCFVAKELAQHARDAGAGQEFLLYQPVGFMNESGEAVRAWVRQKNLTFEEFLVIHDDSDLLVGEYKLVRGGGSAGHKGIESLIAHFGTADFWRLRVGIRDPKEQARRKALEFVLNKWGSAEEKQFRAIALLVWPVIAQQK